MTLSAPQMKKLHTAFLSAYQSQTDIDMMLHFEMEESLSEIVDGAHVASIAFELIKWAEQTGKTADFITASMNYRPGNPELRKVGAEFLLYLDAKGTGPEREDLPNTPPDSIFPKVSKKLDSVIKGFDWVDSVDMAILVYNLASSKYRSRYQQTLVNMTGFSADQLDTLVRSYPEYINRSVAKSGKVIYRLSDEEKRKYNQTIK